MSVEVKTIVAGVLFAGGYGKAHNGTREPPTEDERIVACFVAAEKFVAEGLAREPKSLAELGTTPRPTGYRED